MGWKELTADVAAKVRNTFPTEATYQPATGSSYPITGVFDAAHTEIAILDGAEVQAVYPVFFACLADLAAKPKTGNMGDKLTISGVQYRIAESRPDGEAGTLLILNKL